MAFFQRSYSHESDKILMSALARQYRGDHLHVIDLPYRFSSWAFDDPENVGLWFDEQGQLVAWAVLQTPFWTMDTVCQPAADENLYPEILAWADRRARVTLDTEYGHPAWYVNVFSGQVNRIADLKKAGFQYQAKEGDDSWSKVLMRRSVEKPVKVHQPPAGFTVRPLAGESEVKDYVALHQSIFETKNMTVDWRLRTLQHPAYKPELDLVIESPARHLVAFCIGWFDEQTLSGQVEPLGCLADFRLYALGRVVLAEGLHRLQTHGAKQIFLETDNYRNTAYRLYQSFDFQVIQDVRVYRKDYKTG